MTVGKLVLRQAIKDGHNPELPEELVSSLKKMGETYQKVFENIREPMLRVASMAERLGPQLEVIRKISFPTMPIISSPLYDILGKEDDEPFIYPINRVQEVRIINPEDIAPASVKRAREFAVASYLLPQNAKWESLDVQFIDGHIVKVSYPNMESRKFDFKDMGFINTKTNKPDRKWELLRTMAENSGTLHKKKNDFSKTNFLNHICLQ